MTGYHIARAVTLCCMLLTAGKALGAPPQTLETLFASGNDAFFQGEFALAIERYDTLLEAGVRDPDVYFNLAAAHGRKGELGRAMLYLERASQLRPDDEDIESHLSQVRDALALRAATRSGEATVRTRAPIRQALVASLPENTLALSLLLLEIVTLVLLVLRRRTPDENTRLTLTVATVLSGLLALLAGAGLYVKSGVGGEGEPALVVRQEALREGPDAHAQSRGEAAEGSLSTILLREGDWIQVRIAEGPRGWLPKDSVGVLDPD